MRKPRLASVEVRRDAEGGRESCSAVTRLAPGGRFSLGAEPARLRVRYAANRSSKSRLRAPPRDVSRAPRATPTAAVIAATFSSAERVLGARSPTRCGSTSQDLRPSDGVARERRGGRRSAGPRGFHLPPQVPSAARLRRGGIRAGAEACPQGQLDHPRYSRSGPGMHTTMEAADRCQLRLVGSRPSGLAAWSRWSLVASTSHTAAARQPRSTDPTERFVRCG